MMSYRHAKPCLILSASLVLSVVFMTMNARCSQGNNDSLPKATMEIESQSTDISNSSLKAGMQRILELPAATTLVVLDLDGTLTAHGDPTKKVEGPVAARGQSVTFVNELFNKGYQVILSSAWNKFDETLGKLKQLGLLEKFGASEQGICEEDVSFNDAIKVTVCRSGRVVSVLDSKKRDRHGNFKQKAYAYKFADPPINMNSLTNIVFVDDSDRNIDIWKKDIQDAGIFKGIDVMSVLLTPASEEPKD